MEISQITDRNAGHIAPHNHSLFPVSPVFLLVLALLGFRVSINKETKVSITIFIYHA